MANLELIDPGIDTKHRSHLVGERLPPALRLRTHDECWPLDQRWIPRLRASGLLPLCRLVEPTRPGSFRFPVDRALLSALVDRWRPETHSFHLPVGEMTVTLQDVSMLLGLPIKGLAVVSEAVPVDWKQQLLDRFHGVLPLQQPLLEFDDQHGPTKAWLHQFHTHRLAEDAEDETVRRHLEAYLLWLFGWVLFSSSHHSSVDKHLIFYAQQIADAPLDNIPQFSWGSAVLSGTYRAMCDACTRRSKTATLAGCPLLVMLWCFERFDIGRPVLSSYEEYEAGMYHIGEDGEYDMVDAPMMGFLWTKRNPSWATDTGRLMYPAFVAAFDQLMPDRVRWTPYSPEEVARRTSRGLSILCSRDSELWYTKKCILFDIFVEPYWPERVWRQFGRQQHFPVPRLQLLHNDHMMTRKGQGLDSEAHWASKMAPWAEAWTAARTDVHGPSPPYDDSTYPAYLSWFHGATRWRCVPVPPDREPHVASITDTFATEPSTAFHALLPSFISFF